MPDIDLSKVKVTMPDKVFMVEWLGDARDWGCAEITAGSEEDARRHFALAHPRRRIDRIRIKCRWTAGTGWVDVQPT